MSGIPIAQPPVGNRRFMLPESPKPWEGGIPIAQSPVGNRRFKLPESPKPWEGVREAKQYRCCSFIGCIVWKAR
ncbi:hypothetical protein ANCDUO_08420 [Ancylostoma duodenale]|uniref:Carboxylesterase type B domain-containing protein n=1 Tax=Ancylostoma duodenale TaxID=51022 RepID=A0A0C2GW23_9BILA|nr:hypothetical protein ANCDUO_08420 [Ancylostoma duodenale]